MVADVLDGIARDIAEMACPGSLVRPWETIGDPCPEPTDLLIPESSSLIQAYFSSRDAAWATSVPSTTSLNLMASFREMGRGWALCF